MKRLVISTLIVCMVACTKQDQFTLPQNAKGTGKLLTDWIAVHLRLIKNTTGLSHVAYSRHFAYTSIAFYESLVPGSPGHQSIAGRLQNLNNLPAPQTTQLCWIAAGNSAYASLMRFFYSGNKINLPIIDSLEAAENEQLVNIARYSQAAVTAGNEFGNNLAQAIINWSMQDGSANIHPPYVPPTGDSLWVPTPPAFAVPAAPYWGDNKTIISGSIDNTLAPAPIPFSVQPASPFYNMANDLFAASQNLTTDQKDMAGHWDDSPNGKYVTAFGHWASILSQMITKLDLSLIRSAAIYAGMSIAMNDASISCWKAKYTYNRIRPVSYIRLYLGSPDWTSFITTPAHPEYPAAHSTLSYAAATVLTHYLGNVPFTDHTYDNVGLAPRSYTSFIAAATEAGNSRFYGGIHFLPSIKAGAICGTAVSKNVLVALALRNDD
ncbi:vanadium-dependent haloperoxidase [Danxiaibacter flavus]|uniref:Vanadium-dependent haloperoxidase n=1 Tax=Danxiaibacter flavus TaxID=3049108 RepID=A0ABV3ZLV5_9BACT|nr:vanadium-dependent haloperoxidase [Chitinophagaceae bacterium DXS]